MKLRVLQLIHKYVKRSGPEKLVSSWVSSHDETRFENFVVMVDFSNFDGQSQLEEMLAGSDRIRLIPWNKRKLLMDSAAELSRIIREWNIDVIHCHDIPCDLLAFLAKFMWRNKRIRLVTTRHGYIDYSLKLKLIDALDNLLMRKFGRVIIGSEAMRPTLPKIPESRVILIPNAVSTDFNEPGDEYKSQYRSSLGIGDDCKVITSLGRLSPEKGYEYLLRASKTVCQQYPEARFLIVGEGLQEESLKLLASKLQVTDEVIFAGFQPSIQDVFAITDVFVQASVAESLPLTLLEAMAHELPVVATDVGGVGKVVEDRQNGLLVPSADSDALAEAIQEFIFRPEYAENLGRKGKCKIQKDYSDEEYIRALERVYESVTSE